MLIILFVFLIVKIFSCPGNLESSSNCQTCSGNWIDVLTNCTICPLKFNESDGCIGCSNNWRGRECMICPAPYLPWTNCLETMDYENDLSLITLILMLGIPFFIVILLTIGCVCILAIFRYSVKRNQSLIEDKDRTKLKIGRAHV